MLDKGENFIKLKREQKIPEGSGRGFNEAQDRSSGWIPNLDLSAFRKLVLHFCPWARPPGGDIVKAFLKFAV